MQNKQTKKYKKKKKMIKQINLQHDDNGWCKAFRGKKDYSKVDSVCFGDTNMLKIGTSSNH